MKREASKVTTWVGNEQRLGQGVSQAGHYTTGGIAERSWLH